MGSLLPYSALMQPSPCTCPRHPRPAQVSNAVAIKAAAEKLTMSGRLRVTLRPLMARLPLIGAGGRGQGAAAAAMCRLPRCGTRGSGRAHSTCRA